MWVIFDHLRPSGHIMPDHAGDRGTELLVLVPRDHLHIKQNRTFVGFGTTASASRMSGRGLGESWGGWLWGRGAPSTRSSWILAFAGLVGCLAEEESAAVDFQEVFAGRVPV